MKCNQRNGNTNKGKKNNKQIIEYLVLIFNDCVFCAFLFFLLMFKKSSIGLINAQKVQLN